MSLANNHARDFGEEGRSSSMAALDAAGIHHSGREGTVASFVANGRRIAMVAFAPNVGSNSLNDPQIGLPLVADLAAKHDIVIVSFHGGAEGNGAEVLPFAREIFAGEDRGNVVEFAHSMIDAGADIVLGPRAARGAADGDLPATGSSPTAWAISRRITASASKASAASRRSCW